MSKASREWNARNKEKMNLIQREWRAKNKEHCLEYIKNWKENNPGRLEEYKKVTNKRQALKRKENPNLFKEWYYKNLDKAHAATKAWRAKNKEKVLCYVRNRLAIKKKAEGIHTDQDIAQILKNQNFLCNSCSVFLESYHVDHIIPLSRGGSNWPSNLQCLCPTCNLRKGAKTMGEWLNLLSKQGNINE
jgi:5-methylcytosine-specific restriction endonuclease McrA